MAPEVVVENHAPCVALILHGPNSIATLEERAAQAMKFLRAMQQIQLSQYDIWGYRRTHERMRLLRSYLLPTPRPQSAIEGSI